MAGLMEGKRVMVFGVANERSIAWGISQQFKREGARLGFNFVGDALEKRVRPLAESVDAELVLPCDVTDDTQVAETFERVRETWGGLDVLREHASEREAVPGLPALGAGAQQAVFDGQAPARAGTHRKTHREHALLYR